MRSSSLYEGTVTHDRTGAQHRRFTHRIAMPLLDLDEVESLGDLAPLWKSQGRAPLQFARSDFLGDPATPLRDAVANLVEQRLGFRPSGPIRLLAHHRTWGSLFNPISLYYCYAPSGEDLQAVVADVNNTPWGESHAYVIDTRNGLSNLPDQIKEFHVSPFLPMDLRYHFGLTNPADRCGFSVTARRGHDVVFRAGFSLRRRPLNRRELARLLIRYPFMTHRVLLGIYGHAAAIWLRRTQFVPHPETSG